MPLLGLKGMILAGAAVDVALGLVLLHLASRGSPASPIAALAVARGIRSGRSPASASTNTGWLPVYIRRGQNHTRRRMRSLRFYKDGKTTSVALMQFDEGLSLRTNGKSDGAINLVPARALPTKSRWS